MSIILSFFINLFLFFIFVPSVQAVNLNGEWIAEKGAKGEISQSGNTFSLIVTYSRFEKFIGTTAVKGTITGDTFIGQIYTYTDECPNLNGSVPAKGIISEGKIEIKFTHFAYDPDTCVCISNAKPSEGSITYTRISIPSPTPQLKQSTSKGNEANSQNTKPVGDYESPFSIFAFNPLETWRNIQHFLDIPEGLDDLVGTGEFLFAPDIVPYVVSEASISNYIDSQGMPLNFLPGYIPHESIEPDSTVRVTERTRLSDKNSQTYFELRPGQSNQVVLKIPGEKEKSLPFLEDGEIEVVKNKPGASDSLYGGIKTPNGTVLVVQTHYLVSYDKNKNQTIVVVYKGKVEVKTNEGQSVSVVSDNDLPGVVMIAQKFSTTKLALAGLVLAAIIGAAAVVILKRKFFQKKVGKKR